MGNRASEAVARRARGGILVIDPGGGALDVPGLAVHTCDAGEAPDVVRALEPVVVVVAFDAPDGPALLGALRARAPGTPVVAFEESPGVPGAVAALRAGAVDYVARPALSDAVLRALRAPARPASPADRYGFTPLLTRSPRMFRVFDAVRAVARTDATVLVRGETGTGRELVAHTVHALSRRADRPHVDVRCGAFPDAALEQELFGRGGAFERADGGTLLLAELGDLSTSVQLDLLRVLEEGRFRRGGTDVRVDVRLVVATNMDLEAAVAEGRLREDLFYRLHVFPITLPALRERPEDIPLLLRHFLDDAARGYDLPVPAVTEDALAVVTRFRWPGNVRQLRALCERWVIQAAGGPLGVELLPAELTGRAVEVPGALAIDDTVPLATLTARLTNELERAYLHKLLTRLGGHLQNTAAAAGITRRTLYTRMKELGLDAKDYK